jgi:hypothetical protein
VYVEKTGLIHDLISEPWSSVSNFLSRPRIFCKAFLLETIQYFFQGKREPFSCLEIGRRFGDAWEAFPVIRLSLSNTKMGHDLFGPVLVSTIKLASLEKGIVFEYDDSSSIVQELITRLSLNCEHDLVKQVRIPVCRIP